MRSGAFLMVSGALPALAQATREDPQTAWPRGVIVEEVARDSAAGEAGLQPGDEILSWSRAALPPANPQPATGTIGSPFDLVEVEVEQAPRGPVVLTGRRGGQEATWACAPVPFGLTVRPALPEDLLRFYQEGSELVRASKVAEGAARWRSAAEETRRRGQEVLAVWFLAKAARDLAGAQSWAEADAAYAEATQAAESLPPQVMAAQLHREWSATFRSRGDWSRTAEGFQRALSIDQRIGPERVAVAVDLYRLGVSRLYGGDSAKGAELFQQSLEIGERVAPGSLDVAASLNGLGAAALDRGDLAAAEGYIRPSLKIRERLAPRSRDAASSFVNLGFLLFDRGDLGGAEEHYRRAIAIYEVLEPDGTPIATALNNLGNVMRDRGDLAGAEESYRRGLAIHDKRPAPDPYLAGLLLGGLGTLALVRGDLASAEENLRRALEMSERRAPESLRVAEDVNNLALVVRERGDLAEADKLLRRALALQEKLAPDGLDVAMSLANLGDLLRARGELAGAEDHLQRAVGILDRLAPGSLVHAESLTGLGDVAFDRGDLGSAEERQRKALEIADKLSPGSLQAAQAQHSLGRTQQQAGRLGPAVEHYLRALEVVESLGSKLGGALDVRSGFSAKYTGYYQDALEALIESGQPAEALHVLERSRARSFLAVLAERDLPFGGDLPPELARERTLAEAEFARAQTGLAKLSPAKDAAEVERLRRRLLELRDKKEEMVARVRKASPRFASLQYPQPLDLEGVRRALDPGTVLLAYAVGERRTVLFVVQPQATPGPGLAVFSIAAGAKALRERVEAFRGAIQRRARPGAPSLAAREAELYDLLVRPAEPMIASSQRLLISPDGPLHALAFAALARGREGSRARSSYLVEWKPLHVVASATVYAELKKSRREGAPAGLLVAFGDPRYPTLPTQGARQALDADVDADVDAEVRSFVTRGFQFAPLPAARQEVDAIAALFPTGARKYLGAEATEERAKSLGRDVRYVHFACHGLLDERFPLNSGLALAIPEHPAEGQDNGLLQAWEVFEKVRIDADLVTLSACSTGLGKELGGEGLLGLTRAFHYAGARSVLASLWAVSDASTAMLMKHFYGQLKAGKSLDEALRAAQLKLIGASPGSRPRFGVFHWAAFQLSGDWR